MKSIKLLIILLLTTNIIVGNDLRFFEGIGGKFGYNEQDSIEVPMGHQEGGQLNFVLNHDSMTTQDAVIIAHSQGGLRAMALAGYLERTGNSNTKIDTIITIGSPINGYSPLVNGVAPLRSDLSSAVNTIVQALNRAADLVDVDTTLEDDVLASLGVGEGGLIDIVAGNGEGEGTSIPDMKPGSSFIVSNIRGLVVSWRTVKTFFGTYRYPILSIEYKLPKDTNYGFIVGKQSDILELMGDTPEYYDTFGYSLGFFGDYQLNPNVIKYAYTAATEAAHGLYEAEAIRQDTLGFIAGLNPFTQDAARNHRQNAADARTNAATCKAGANWVYNHETNYSKLLGTVEGENDCFIPTKDQYMDVAQIGGNPVDGVKGLYDSDNLHHLNEMDSREIWGGGSLHDAEVGTSGVISDWLNYQGISQREGEVIK